MRRIATPLLPLVLAGALVLTVPAARPAPAASRPATIVVSERFSPRGGVPIEGYKAYMKVTRVRDKHVVIDSAFDMEQHPARLVIAPGNYELERYVREGGGMACTPSSCVEQLGYPSVFCAYHLRLVSGRLVSLVVTATRVRCSIRRAREASRRPGRSHGAKPLANAA